MKVKTKSETRKLRKQLVFQKTSISIVDSKPVIIAKEKIFKDEVVFLFEGRYYSHPNSTSIQIDVSRHIDVPSGFDTEDQKLYWKFLGHSCDPSGYINTEDLTFVALRDIESGEALTYDYNTTEFDIFYPFDCTCKSDNCTGRVSGFKHLDKEIKKKIQPKLAPHLKLFFLYDCSFIM